MTEKKHCPSCNKDVSTVYDDKWDAYYCTKCRTWLDIACDDPDDCEFCKDRPAKKQFSKGESQRKKRK